MKAKVRRLDGVQSLMQKRLELENRRMEAEIVLLDNYVDPREQYIDDATGELWLPLVGSTDVHASPFRNEGDLQIIRQRSRIMYEKNPYAKNFVNNLVAFCVGTGHVYTCVVRKAMRTRPGYKHYAKIVQRFVDSLMYVNKWSRRQQDVVRRYHRDGEAFIRLFYLDNGMTIFRFVQPSQVRTPDKYKDREDHEYGIQVDPDDAELVINYFVDDEVVPAYEMQHRKANVDMDVKRGLPTLYCARDNLDRAVKLLRNMSQTVANQVSIGMIRRHKGATRSSVQSFASSFADARITDQYKSETTSLKKTSPGAILDTTDNIEHEFPSIGINAATPVAILQAELRAIASAKSQPEYMVGSDASNASYQSTMVAESPGVRSMEVDQATLVAEDLELIWAAIEHAVNSGLLPKAVLNAVEVQAKGPRLVSRDPLSKSKVDDIYLKHHVKSPQTVASEEGMDFDQEQENWRAIPGQATPVNPQDNRATVRTGRFTPLSGNGGPGTAPGANGVPQPS